MRTIWVVLLAATVAACGFQPRGASHVRTADTVMFLDAPALLHDELSIFLLDIGADLAATREEADVVLEVRRETFDSRTLSVDPDTGKEREFEITYEVTFLARDASGALLLEPQTVSLLRDYVFDEDRVIGKSRERDTLRSEMRRDAAQQILTRVSRAVGG